MNAKKIYCAHKKPSIDKFYLFYKNYPLCVDGSSVSAKNIFNQSFNFLHEQCVTVTLPVCIRIRRWINENTIVDWGQRAAAHTFVAYVRASKMVKDFLNSKLMSRNDTEIAVYCFSTIDSADKLGTLANGRTKLFQRGDFENLLWLFYKWKFWQSN